MLYMQRVRRYDQSSTNINYAVGFRPRIDGVRKRVRARRDVLARSRVRSFKLRVSAIWLLVGTLQSFSDSLSRTLAPGADEF